LRKEACHETLIGGEPLQAVGGFGSQPAGILMFFQRVAAVGEVAKIAVHGEVEVGVVVFDSCVVLVDDYHGIHLLLQLAKERLFTALTLLYLATGELPPAAPLAIASLGGEYAVAVADDGCHHFDALARPLSRFLALEEHFGRTIYAGGEFHWELGVECRGLKIES